MTVWTWRSAKLSEAVFIAALIPEPAGDTTEDLLARFERDAAFYQPHAVFITIGGNDYLSENITREEYGDNLRHLCERFSGIGCGVILQTYYAPDADDVNLKPTIQTFYDYMQDVRDIACETASGIVDHLARWEPLRRSNKEVYRTLMQDPFHVNRLGNMVMGLDIARAYNLQLGADRPGYWRYPRACQALMDAAENE